MSDVKQLNDDELKEITGGVLSFSSGEEKQIHANSFESKFKNIVPEGLYSQLYGSLFGNRMINIKQYNLLIDKYSNYINNAQTVSDLKNFSNDFNTIEIVF